MKRMGAGAQAERAAEKTERPCSGQHCLDERGVIAWMDRAWRVAVREGWDWEGYYFHLVKVGLSYIMLHRHGRLL